MSYLLLSPNELIEFTEDVRKRYGLIVIERPAYVDLDYSKYRWVAWKKSYAFSYINVNGRKQPIIIQNGDGTVLYAGTREQFYIWKKYKVVSEPIKWTFGRFIQWMDQVARNNNLISPAKDLEKLNQLLVDIFYEGENNGEEE